MSERPAGPQTDNPSLLKTLRFYYDMSTDTIRTIADRFERYGDLYFNVSRGDPLFVTKHPDHAYEVLVSRAQSWVKRQDLEPVLGNGLLNSNGEVWRRQRRLMNPSFRSDRIISYGKMIVEETERTMGGWRAGEQRDVAQDMMALTLRIVSRALFGHDADGETEAIGRVMNVLQEAATSLDLLPPWVPTPMHVRAKRALEEIDRIVYDLIDSKRPAEGEDNLLTDLLAASDEDGGMSRKLLRDELVTMFLAGHETTSLALSWTLYLLAKNPEERTRVEAEVDETEDPKALEVLGRALSESMRMYPPAYVVPRIAAEDTQIGGFHVERGAEVVIWIFHMHRDERWFPEPKKFDPDRFLDGSDRVRHPHAYIPFGAGSRTCIGRHFAMFEAKLILRDIMKRWQLDLAPGAKVTSQPRVTFGMKNGLRMKLTPR